MRINLISDHNGVGLSQDMQLLGTWLRARGHEVTEAAFQQDSPQADVNFYLELFDPRHLASAPQHVGVFNLEWFYPAWLPYLANMTQLWAKSSIAFEWYIERGYDQAIYTGFLSQDMFSPTVYPSEAPRALHVRGKSSAKGTEAILEAYRNDQTLPPLTVISHSPTLSVAPNVQIFYGVQPHAWLVELMNTCQYHLCPSEVEGWGHYITEAASAKGLIVTTDASPMHEHVSPKFGRLLTPVRETFDNLGVARSFVEPSQIAKALHELVEIQGEDRAMARSAARTWWRLRQERFNIDAGAALDKLG